MYHFKMHFDQNFWMKNNWKYAPLVTHEMTPFLIDWFTLKWIIPVFIMKWLNSRRPQCCQLFVCLAPAFLTHQQHFTSLSLHASVLHPNPQPSALHKTLHFMSFAPPRAPSSVGQGSGHPSAQTGGTACAVY